MKSVYVIRDTGTGNYKIGKTTKGTPYDRLRTLQTGNSHELDLTLTAQMDNPDEWEPRLHGLFDPKRVRGEWFALDNYDLRFIVTRCYLVNLGKSILILGPKPFTYLR